MYIHMRKTLTEISAMILFFSFFKNEKKDVYSYKYSFVPMPTMWASTPFLKAEKIDPAMLAFYFETPYE